MTTNMKHMREGLEIDRQTATDTSPPFMKATLLCFKMCFFAPIHAQFRKKEDGNRQSRGACLLLARRQRWRVTPVLVAERKKERNHGHYHPPKKLLFCAFVPRLFWLTYFLWSSFDCQTKAEALLFVCSVCIQNKLVQLWICDAVLSVTHI